MKRAFLFFLAIVLLSFFAAQSRGQEEMPPRVVGEPQSEEQFNAWTELEAATPQDKAQLAQQFLETFPESGMVPVAHQILALHYLEQNETERFIQHAEQSLMEIKTGSNSAVILTALARSHAQKGSTSKAIEKGKEGLQLIQMLQKPPESPPLQWNLQKAQLQAEANYALGFAYLYAFVQQGGLTSPDTDPDLHQAIEHFDQCIELDPSHGLAYYYLGDSWVRKNDAENALKNFARASASEPGIASTARQDLDKIYKYMHPKKSNENDQAYQKRVVQALDDLTARERQYVQEKISQNQAKLEQSSAEPTLLSAEPEPSEAPE